MAGKGKRKTGGVIAGSGPEVDGGLEARTGSVADGGPEVRMGLAADGGVEAGDGERRAWVRVHEPRRRAVGGLDRGRRR